MVVERKGLTDWDPWNQHARGVPIRPTAKKRGRKGLTTYRLYYNPPWINGLSKPTGNVASNEIIIGDFNYVNLIFKIFLI